MGDVDRSDAELLLDAANLGAHVHAQLGVQVGQRLVEEQYARLHDQRAGQRNALLLAAGELVGEAVLHALQAHELEHVEHLGANLRFGHVAQLQAVGHVVEDVHVGEQRVALEHHCRVALVGGQLVDGLVAQVDFALVRGLKAGDHAQRGGLAAAGGAQQGHELARLDVQVDGIHGLEGLVGLGVQIYFGYALQAHTLFDIAHWTHSFMFRRLPSFPSRDGCAAYS